MSGLDKAWLESKGDFLFASLCEMERDAVIICATLAEGKVHTHCVPGACVLDVSVQIPVISKGDESDRSCCTWG